jgi:transcriptional regulator with XRE-family HTH domain
MTGAELKAIRQALGFTLSGFGRALGYSGNKNTLSVQIRRFESGARPIPANIEAKAKAKLTEKREVLSTKLWQRAWLEKFEREH